VIEPGMTGAMTGVDQDLFLPLRRENIPNLENLTEQFKVDNLTYDPGDEPHIVPWVWGTAGLVHNTEQMSSQPTVWEDLFTDETDGKVAMNTVAWLELGPIEHAAFALGYDISDFSENYEEKMDDIFGKIAEWDEYMLQWFDSGSTMQQLLKNESAIAGTYWYGRYLAAKEAGAPIDFKIPDDGTSMWIDNWAIAQGTEHRYTAEKFLDYSLTQDAHAAFSAEFPYASSVELDNPPEPLQESPVPDNRDKIHMADMETLYANRKNIQKRFQETIRA
jgi:spermidine/putrescine-binding protein